MNRSTLSYSVGRSLRFALAGLVVAASGVVATELAASGAAPPTITSFTISEPVIYSTVQDDYLDETEISWDSGDWIDETSDVTITAPSGEVVAVKQSSFGDGYYTWRGQVDSTGGQASPGSYLVTVTVTDEASGESSSATQTITVKTEKRWEKKTAQRYGSQLFFKKASRGCSVTRFAGIGMSFECHGGRYAIGKWRLRIPTDARIGKLKFEKFPLSFPGKLTESGKRVSKQVYIATLRVSGHRGVEIDSVTLYYKVPYFV